VSAPVVAVLHHLERPVGGHADAVLHGAGVVLEALFGGFARRGRAQAG